jgi:hypothetical protein
VAAQWELHPEDWKWIGWRKWHCYLFDDLEDLPAYQEFEQGLVIGGLRPILKDPSEAEMFILFNDPHSPPGAMTGHWSSVGMTGVKAPGFELPNTKPPGGSYN